MSNLQNDYWMVVLGTIFAFTYAFGIGANDVANSFGPSVASKSFKLRNAIIAAMICEFVGALLGASVYGTVKGKVFNPKIYDDEPEVIMLGMFCSLATGSLMLLVATWNGLSISTTHVIVGCIMGFTITAKGFESVDWTQVVNIFITWIVSPLATGVVAFFFFFIIRRAVLESHNPFHRTFLTFPFVLIAGIAINIFYVLYKGLNNLDFSSQVDVSWCLPVALGIGIVSGLLWLMWFGPYAKQRVIAKIHAQEEAEEKAAEAAAKPAEDAERAIVEVPEEQDAPETVQVANQKGENIVQRFIRSRVGQDLYAQSMKENKRAREIWQIYKKYDSYAEELFTSIQTFTSCVNSLAHGANDVSNAIAPLSAIYQIYNDGALGTNSTVPKWMLVYGGLGISIGGFLFGYRVMKAIGYKISASSPSRATAAELSSSLFVLTANFAGIPVSTTQCICGAVTGVGLATSIREVNWFFLLQLFFGWVGIFLVSVMLNAAFFAIMASALGLKLN